MFEKALLQVRCICDVCRKKSEWVPRADLSRLIKTWQFRAYKQSNGYRFFVLACSDACQDVWRERYFVSLKITEHENVPLWKGLRFWHHAENEEPDKIFAEMKRYGDRESI